MLEQLNDFVKAKTKLILIVLKHVRPWVGTLVQLLWEKTRVQEVVISNPCTRFQVDTSKFICDKIQLMFEKTVDRPKRGRYWMAHFKTLKAKLIDCVFFTQVTLYRRKSTQFKVKAFISLCSFRKVALQVECNRKVTSFWMDILSIIRRVKM